MQIYDFSLYLKNCTVVNSSGCFSADIGVRNGLIAYIGEPGAMKSPSAEIMLDLQGLYVLPGLIDAHVHMRDPGLTYKEDVEHATAAAVCGGITMVCDMPNTRPNVTEASVLKAKIKNAAGRAFGDYMYYAMISDANLDKLDELAETKPCAFKCYMAFTSMKNPQISDAGMREALFRLKEYGYPLHVHAENTNIIDASRAAVKARSSSKWVSYLEARPSISEYEPAQRAVMLAEETEGHIHICHISTKESVEIIRRAKQRGVHVTCETGPQCLLFCDEDYERIGPPLFVNPPVRYKADRDAIWQGLLDGTIDFIATDHAPHTREEKYRGEWYECQPGSAGVEQNIPVLLSFARQGRLTLEQVVKVCGENPAKHFGLYPNKGVIQVGSEGTFTVVDMSAEKMLHDSDAHSLNCISPYDGFYATALPVYTILRGKIAAKDGELYSLQHSGKYIRGKG